MAERMSDRKRADVSVEETDGWPCWSCGGEIRGKTIVIRHLGEFPISLHGDCAHNLGGRLQDAIKELSPPVANRPLRTEVER